MVLANSRVKCGSLWVNFNSPLLWDVFAISTYLSVSLVFWWTGLLPDFAMIRDRAVRPFQKKIYSLLSFGWSGRAKDWQRFEEVSLVLAGFQRNNIDFSVQYHFQQYGIDSSGINFGSNMFESYNTKITDYNHQIGQGNLVKQNLVIVQLSYLFAALTNTKIFIRYNYIEYIW